MVPPKTMILGPAGGRGTRLKPLCHSTLATTRRARSQLSARYQKSSYRITGRFGGLPTGRISKGAISYCSTLLLGSRIA